MCQTALIRTVESCRGPLPGFKFQCTVLDARVLFAEDELAFEQLTGPPAMCVRTPQVVCVYEKPRRRLVNVLHLWLPVSLASLQLVTVPPSRPLSRTIMPALPSSSITLRVQAARASWTIHEQSLPKNANVVSVLLRLCCTALLREMSPISERRRKSAPCTNQEAQK